MDENGVCVCVCVCVCVHAQCEWVHMWVWRVSVRDGRVQTDLPIIQEP